METEFWKYPRLLEGYWCILTGAEQKLLDFILRQTIGWYDPKSGRQKKSERISLSTFAHGTGKNNRGTGLCKSSIIKGLEGLEEKGFIKKEYGGRARGTNIYNLVVQKMDKDCLNNGQSGSAKNGQGDSPISGQIIESLNRKFDKEIIIERICHSFDEKILPGARINENVKNLIAERLKNYSEDQIEEAITLFSKNDWWMERNARNGPAWFFKSDAQINKFLNIKSFPERY